MSAALTQETEVGRLDLAIRRVSEHLARALGADHPALLDFQIVSLSARDAAAGRQAKLDSLRYEYLLDCELQAAVKYVPDLDPVEFKAGRRVKHDRDRGGFYAHAEFIPQSEPEVFSYDFSAAKRTIRIRWPDGQHHNYHRTSSMEPAQSGLPCIPVQLYPGAPTHYGNGEPVECSWKCPNHPRTAPGE